MILSEIVQRIGELVDLAGVAVILIGIVVATVQFVRNLLDNTGAPGDVYRAYRRRLGQGLLLGLEFLVAADIIRTVAVMPTLENVAVLAIIVLIRTFLAWSLEVEIDGRLPWRRHRDSGASGSA